MHAGLEYLLKHISGCSGLVIEGLFHHLMAGVSELPYPLQSLCKVLHVLQVLTTDLPITLSVIMSTIIRTWWGADTADATMLLTPITDPINIPTMAVTTEMFYTIQTWSDFSYCVIYSDLLQNLQYVVFHKSSVFYIRTIQRLVTGGTLNFTLSSFPDFIEFS